MLILLTSRILAVRRRQQEGEKLTGQRATSWLTCWSRYCRRRCLLRLWYSRCRSGAPALGALARCYCRAWAQQRMLLGGEFE